MLFPVVKTDNSDALGGRQEGYPQNAQPPRVCNPGGRAESVAMERDASEGVDDGEGEASAEEIGLVAAEGDFVGGAEGGIFASAEFGADGGGDGGVGVFGAEIQHVSAVEGDAGIAVVDNVVAIELDDGAEPIGEAIVSVQVPGEDVAVAVVFVLAAGGGAVVDVESGVEFAKALIE